METWDAIRARRNVRSFADRPVPAADLDRILEAGRLAPSAMNGQPWEFVLVTQRDALRDLARVWEYAAHVAVSAATIAVLGHVPQSERERDLLQYDLGQATMAMMIAAADLGVGSGHASVADQELARRLLGFPGDRFCAYLVALGYPADRPLAPVKRFNRRPFDDVVHRERW